VVPTLLERLAWGQHVRVRTAAAGALAEVGARLVVRDRIREALEPRVDDRDFRVQMAAIAALRALGDERALPALRRAAAQATDGRVRRACRAACRRLEQRAERAPELAKLADGVEALRGEVAKLLDRVQRLEGAPAPRRVSPAGKRASAARKRGHRRGR
jgi:HEAT repeat protein